MPQQCLVIQDTETGKFLFGWDPVSNSATWTGDEADAMCFSNENDRQAVLDLLNSGGGSRFVGPNPKPR